MPHTDVASITSIPKPKGCVGRRHLQFLMMFCAIFLAYGMRTNISVGIIAMMDDNPPHPDIPTFPEWTMKNIILSSFFWGDIIPQLFAGQLVEKFGPKRFLAVTMSMDSLFCILTPIFAQSIGQGGVVLCRFIQGLSQGFLYPSTHYLIGKWTPLAERSRIASFIYTGGPLGTVIAMPLTGIISESNVGWPIAFYIYGGLGFTWMVLWVLFGQNNPIHDPKISQDELIYIEGHAVGNEEEKLITPWKDILLSMSVWAIVFAHFGQNWGFWTLQTQIPSYMHNIMGFDIQNNSLLSALPYLVLWLLNFFFSPLADFLIVNQYLTIGNTRKLLNSIGMVLPASALIGLSFIDSSDHNLAISLLVLAVGINCATYSGFNVNHIDLSPNHAGTLMGLTNFAATIAAILAPLIVQAIQLDETDPSLWQIVFCVAAGVNLVTNLLFVIFASGDIQDWDEIEDTSSPKKVEIT